MNERNNNWLVEHRNDVKSQFGEDGILEKIFETVGSGKKWCVELGALNGTHDSNTWNLINNHGWHGVLIEADITYFSKLQALYAGNDKVTCINEFVSFEGQSSLDEIFSKTQLPQDFDLLSLDIDGNEYHLWRSLTKYGPRVVVVEFNQTIPNDINFIQPRDMKVFQGSSILAITKLAGDKGYELVCTTGDNAFFVKKELFPLFGISDNTLDKLRSDKSLYTRLFQLYDGTVVLDGYKRLLWHDKEIDHEAIQVLPRSKRKYPAKINSYKSARLFKYWARRLPVYGLVQKVRKLLRR